MFDNIKVSLKNFCNGCVCCETDTVVRQNEPIPPVHSQTEVTVTQTFYRVHRVATPEFPKDEK